MFKFNVEILEDEYELNEHDFLTTKVDVRWNQEYDNEQLLEHAIVHLLRHRK